MTGSAVSTTATPPIPGLLLYSINGHLYWCNSTGTVQIGAETVAPPPVDPDLSTMQNLVAALTTSASSTMPQIGQAVGFILKRLLISGS